jgi:enoyl-CoA hydratase
VAVTVEPDGDVYTVALDRPQVRDAVDREHAEALADAFRAFEESDAAVAVLFGAGGTFCAGADLKALSKRVEPDGDGPATQSRADSNSRSGATCESRTRTRSSASSPAASASR